MLIKPGTTRLEFVRCFLKFLKEYSVDVGKNAPRRNYDDRLPIIQVVELTDLIVDETQRSATVRMTIRGDGVDDDKQDIIYFITSRENRSFSRCHFRSDSPLEDPRQQNINFDAAIARLTGILEHEAEIR